MRDFIIGAIASEELAIILIAVAIVVGGTIGVLVYLKSKKKAPQVTEDILYKDKELLARLKSGFVILYNDLDGSLTELKKSVDTLRDKAEYASPSKQNEVYRIDLEIEKTIDSLKHSNGIGYKTDLITPEILKRISLMFDERNEETARYRR